MRIFFFKYTTYVYVIATFDFPMSLNFRNNYVCNLNKISNILRCKKVAMLSFLDVHKHWKYIELIRWHYHIINYLTSKGIINTYLSLSYHHVWDILRCRKIFSTKFFFFTIYWKSLVFDRFLTFLDINNSHNCYSN